MIDLELIIKKYPIKNKIWKLDDSGVYLYSQPIGMLLLLLLKDPWYRKFPNIPEKYEVSSSITSICLTYNQFITTVEGISITCRVY